MDNFNEKGESHESVNAPAVEIKTPPVKDTTPRPAFEPFAEQVNEKSYARSNVKIDAKQAAQPIPEPIHVPPPIAPQTPNSPPKVPPTPANPALATMSKEEQLSAARKMAEMAVSGYEFLHIIVNKAIEINPNGKVKTLEKNGEVDLKIGIPYGGQIINVDDFIEDWNRQNKTVIVVTPEFKKEILPVLERVFAKHGIGATDEQQLLQILLTDVSIKFVMMQEVIRQRRQFFRELKEYTQAYRAGNGFRPQPQHFTPPPPVQPQAPPPPQPQPQYPPPPPTPQYYEPPVFHQPPPEPPEYPTQPYIPPVPPPPVPPVIVEPEYLEPGEGGNNGENSDPFLQSENLIGENEFNLDPVIDNNLVDQTVENEVPNTNTDLTVIEPQAVSEPTITQPEPEPKKAKPDKKEQTGTRRKNRI